MTHVRNIDWKMKVQTEENFQKTIMDEIINLKKVGHSGCGVVKVRHFHDNFRLAQILAFILNQGILSF